MSSTKALKLVVALAPDGSGGYAGTFVVGLSGLPAGVGTSTGTGSTATTNASEPRSPRRAFAARRPAAASCASPAR